MRPLPIILITLIHNEAVVILRGVQFINEWCKTAYIILIKLWKKIISRAENAWDD